MGSLEDLYSDLGMPFSEEQICFMCFEVLQALDHLHSKDMIHRDIKARNILLTKKGRIKLADFGLGKPSPFMFAYAETACLATPMFKEERKSFVGTVHWMAPEVINATESQRPYTFAIGTKPIHF